MKTMSCLTKTFLYFIHIYLYNGYAQIYKVPATDVEALKSSLMGLFEKRRLRKFFIFVQDFVENDPKTHDGMDLNTVTAKELIT